MQLTLFQITEEEIFQAYYDCRKHKRNSREAIEFELDAEHNLLLLLDEINSFSYKIGPSSVFIIDKPVKREVFAASFRDRIVHHLLINIIGECIEKRFIFDCYACRECKGTHLGIDRLRKALSANPDGWALKMDVKGFFMSIKRDLLWKWLSEYLTKNLFDPRLDIILHLTKLIIFNDPTKDCIYLCPKSKWDNLPREKSLFYAKKNCGLPIGNLTSQVFANFYMSSLDHYVKHDLGIRWYGRYVDDFYLVHHDCCYLKECRDKIISFVKGELRMEINNKKTYLQRCDKGVKFLGVKIERGHINASNRTTGNFNKAIDEGNRKNRIEQFSLENLVDYRSQINSYLGILSHYNTFRLRLSIVERMDNSIAKRIRVRGGVRSIKIIK